jgi:3,4-dihydroxy 2-butanone 4-phosphate synthase/GTP cyclohydrolase II
MARRPELEAFARRHDLKIGTIADLIRYRLRNERSVERVKAQPVQTELGEFTLYAYEDRVSEEVHLALTRGKLRGDEPPLVRVHVVDPLRDLLGIRADPLAWTLRAAMERIARAGSGVIVILRDRESSGDLLESVRTLATGDAQPDAAPGAHTQPRDGEVLRTFGVGAQILKDLGVRRMRVLSAPKQIHGISGFGLEIESYVGEDV